MAPQRSRPTREPGRRGSWLAHALQDGLALRGCATRGGATSEHIDSLRAIEVDIRAAVAVLLAGAVTETGAGLRPASPIAGAIAGAVHLGRGRAPVVARKVLPAAGVVGRAPGVVVEVAGIVAHQLRTDRAAIPTTSIPLSRRAITCARSSGLLRTLGLGLGLLGLGPGPDLGPGLGTLGLRGIGPTEADAHQRHREYKQFVYFHLNHHSFRC